MKSWWLLAMVASLPLTMAFVWHRGGARQETEVSIVRTADLWSPAEAGIGRFVPPACLPDLAGKATNWTQFAGKRGTVILLTSATCPVSKRMTTATIDLAKKYQTQGFGFVIVNVAPDEDAKEISAQKNRLGLPYLVDKKGEFSKTLGAKTTTEVFVVDIARTLLYRGALSDQYGVGMVSDSARNAYLANALDQIVQGEPITIEATHAPGCALASSESVPKMAGVTYTREVSRILQRNCVSCHRPGGVGPFRLDNFKDVKARAPMIAGVTKDRIMPPWFANPAEGQPKWANDRSLSESDIATLQSWVQAGTPEGDPKDLPIPVKYPSEWTIGKPDLIVQLPQPVPVKADGFMNYVNITVPLNLTEDKWVTATQILPTDRAVVHHVLVFITENGRRFTSDDEGVSGFFAGYVPGTDSFVMPAGLAKKLPKGSQLRFQIHYTPNGVATTDQLRLGLKFASEPPRQELKTVALASLRFEIPPFDPNHRVEARLRVPFDAEIQTFMPHMHVRGKAYRYEVILPSGEKKLLLDIPHYDFNWQLQYVPIEPIKVPKGSTLIGTAWFDNSKENPANPNPAATVRFGDQTYEEMMLGYFNYTGGTGRLRNRLFGGN